MDKQLTTEEQEPRAYEEPSITDYGTLAEVTAGRKSGKLDGIFGAPGGIGFLPS
jgi:hypothetical protein